MSPPGPSSRRNGPLSSPPIHANPAPCHSPFTFSTKNRWMPPQTTSPIRNCPAYGPWVRYKGLPGELENTPVEFFVPFPPAPSWGRNTAAGVSGNAFQAESAAMPEWRYP
jgi:hypothetical protein